MKARFVHGNPIFIDHTPGGDISAGDVVVIGDRPYIAHKDMASGQLMKGALAAFGGVYDFEKDGTTGPTIDAGEEIFWIEGDKLATDVEAGNIHIGPAIEAAGTNVAVVRALHIPNGLVDGT